MELVLASFAHAARHEMCYSRQGYPRITQSQGHGVLTALPHATTHIINSAYVTELLYDGDLDVGLFRLAIQRQHKVNWAYITSIVEDPFLWYDWHTVHMVRLPIRECRKVTLSISNFVKLCVRIFPAMDAHLTHPELWTPERARLEVDKCARNLNFIPTMDDTGTNDPSEPIPDPASPTLEVAVGTE